MSDDIFNNFNDDIRGGSTNPDTGLRNVTVVMPDKDDDMVMVPRDEYNEMLTECAILRAVEKLLDNDKTYCEVTAIRSIISVIAKE